MDAIDVLTALIERTYRRDKLGRFASSGRGGKGGGKGGGKSRKLGSGPKAQRMRFALKKKGYKRKTKHNSDGSYTTTLKKGKHTVTIRSKPNPSGTKVYSTVTSKGGRMPK